MDKSTLSRISCDRVIPPVAGRKKRSGLTAPNYRHGCYENRGRGLITPESLGGGESKSRSRKRESSFPH